MKAVLSTITLPVLKGLTDSARARPARAIVEVYRAVTRPGCNDGNYSPGGMKMHITHVPEPVLRLHACI
jgi:hypothetical protein